jgi:hypothetical protein
MELSDGSQAVQFEDLELASRRFPNEPPINEKSLVVRHG